MTMHHEKEEEKGNPIAVGALVRATKQLVDDDAAETWPDDQILKLLRRPDGRPVVAEPGDVGRVLCVDGECLIVAWRNAPCATSHVLGDDCAPFMQLVGGGLS